jgi:hypothetical protein
VKQREAQQTCLGDESGRGALSHGSDVLHVEVGLVLIAGREAIAADAGNVGGRNLSRLSVESTEHRAQGIEHRT